MLTVITPALAPNAFPTGDVATALLESLELEYAALDDAKQSAFAAASLFALSKGLLRHSESAIRDGETTVQRSDGAIPRTRQP